MENIVTLLIAIGLFAMYFYFVYEIEKSDEETKKYIDEHYHNVGSGYIRKY